MICSRGKACRLSKYGGKCVRTAEAQRQRDVRDGRIWLLQHLPRMLDATPDLVFTWRNPERLFEATAKMVGTQPDEIGQRRKRYPLCMMLLDV